MKNREIWVYDIETLRSCFTYTALNIDTQDIVSYVIHNTRNDIKALVTHLNTVNGHIGYNNLSFDGQVIQWIIEKYEKLLKLDFGDAISDQIYNYAQITIEKSNKSEWGDYPEWKLKIPQLDLFKVWHFNNKNKMTSLKWVEYSIDLPNIEEMPISHDSIIEENQIQSILDYNFNDVIATYEFYKITIGDTDHPLYKGVDKIQLRRDIKKEFGIKCTNFNDVKIGDEINKLSYTNLLKIDKKNIPKPIKDNNIYKFKDCFPNYIKFKTIEFNNFVNGLSNIEIKSQKKNKKSNKKEQEFEFTFNGTTYCIAKGGIHSKDKPRIIKPNNNEILRDADIGLKIRLWSN